MKKVMIEGKVVFTGSYEKCVKYCKSMGYMVYNGICWDFKFADIAIV
jgi:hypothetical protein